MRYSVAVASLFAAVKAITSPPSGAVVVASSGGNYNTIQAAVDSGASTIFIQPGTYREQVYIPSGRSRLTIYGYSTTTDYSGNRVTITAGRGADEGISNDLTGTVRAHSDNFAMYNINIVNSRGEGTQAIALSAYGDQQGYYGCSIQGFQDTVLSNDGHHYIARSQITGATDFIFGQRARLWIENTDIGVLARSIGYVTANGRDSDSNPSYYVINNSRVQAAPGQSVTRGAYYLGRPWRNYSRVVFQNSQLGAVINQAGWRVWGTDQPNTDHVTYGEYANSGDGAWNSARASFATRLSSPVSMATVLGSGYTGWVDGSYLVNADTAAETVASPEGGDDGTAADSGPVGGGACKRK